MFADWDDLLQKNYYDNTLEKWLLGAFILLSSMLLSLLCIWGLRLFNKVYAKKTDTVLDDYMVEKLTFPLATSVFWAGIYILFNYLVWSSAVYIIFSHFLAITFTLIVAWIAIRFLNALVEGYWLPKIEKEETAIDASLILVIERSFGIIVMFIAFIIGLKNAGYDVNTLLAGLGLGGFALAIAARTTIFNIFGGLTVFFTTPFKTGHRIIIDNFDGYVERIGLSTTRIRSFDDESVAFIPNHFFAEKKIINISQSDGFQRSFIFVFPIDTEIVKINKVKLTLLEIAKEHKQIVGTPRVMIDNFTDAGIQLLFLCMIHSKSAWWDIQHEIAIEILQKFREQDIRFTVRSTLKALPPPESERIPGMVYPEEVKKTKKSKDKDEE
ncbi:MAG: hypothetical protein EAZ55_00950 [Cytophagales bacterium]|nr:MAG: hypothetical protein EAZ55_00950 [Cytophagales bacterium]